MKNISTISKHYATALLEASKEAGITTEIDNMENSLKEMKKAKKDLEDQIKQARLAELDEIISEKGLSFEEVKELLTK